MNNIQSKTINIDHDWINETKQLLVENKDYIKEIFSLQIRKFPQYNLPKTLNTIELFHKELKEKNNVISTIFLSNFVTNFNVCSSDYSLVPKGLKIEMAKNEILCKTFPLDELQKIIDKYHIDITKPEWQKAVIEIANLIAQKDHWSLAENIQKLQISDQEARTKLAKLLAKKSPSAIVNFINRFNLSDQAHLEIAELIAELDPEIFISNITEFKIIDEEARIKIAKSIAQKKPSLLAKKIGKFKISNEASLIEIAKLIVNTNPSKLIKNISKFKIVDKVALSEIAGIIYQKDSKLLLQFLNNLEIDYAKFAGQKALIDMFNEMLKTKFATESSIEKFKYRIKDPPWDNPLQQLRLWIWMIKIIDEGCRTEELRQLFINQQPLIHQISMLEPQLRDSLTEIYIDLFSNQTQKERFLESSIGLLNHMQLTHLLFAVFPPIGRDDYQKALQTIRHLREELRVGKNQKLVLETLLKIKNSSLIDEKKLSLIHLLFETEKWKPDNFRLVRDLFAFKAEHQIDKVDKVEDLKKILEKIFNDRFLVNIDEFSTKYEKNMSTWRNNEALTTYASKLNELHGEEKELAHQFLKEVLQNVLEGSFQKNRYRTDNNPHMKEIENSHPILFLKWQEGCQLDISETQTGKKEDLIIENLNASMELLKEKIKDIPNDRLAIYQIDLQQVKEELMTLQMELEPAIAETASIKKNIEIVSQEIKNLKTFKENKEDRDIKIKQKKAELNSLRNELDLKQRLKTKEIILKALNNPHQENLISLQNLINKEIEFYKTHKDIHHALKEFSKSIDATLGLWMPRGKLAEEDFDKVMVPIMEGLEKLFLNNPTHYLLFRECLQDKGKIESAIQQINAAISTLNPSGKTKKEQNGILLERLYYLKEKTLLNVLKKPEIKHLESLLSLFNKEKDAFYQNIEKALTLSKHLSKSYEITVIDTDDPNHFLLMGTEVEASCQHIDGDADLNKCLLGYFLDGKNRLALVCDPTGKILARSLLRLLVNNLGQPVLFQEILYVADTSPDYKILIRKIAKKKAEILGIPLVVNKKDFSEDVGEDYSFDLYAKDKPVPFEYVDALRDQQLASYMLKKEDLIQV